MQALVEKWNQLFSEERSALFVDLSLLLMRIGIGLMMAFSHGLGKLQKLFAGGAIRFPDPIGVGAKTSLFLAGTSEFVCALAIVIGLGTRLAAVPLAFTMFIAVVVIHGGDPFKKKEFALLYLLPCIMFMLTGPGRFSIDAIIRKKFSK